MPPPKEWTTATISNEQHIYTYGFFYPYDLFVFIFLFIDAITPSKECDVCDIH